jgi:hypothetical protein
MKNITKLCTFLLKGGVVYVAFALPILVYMTFYMFQHTNISMLEYILLIFSMIIVNTFFGLILFGSIRQAVKLKNYKHLKQRAIYPALVPLYVLFVCTILCSTYIEKYTILLLIGWGYGFGLIFMIIKFIFLKLNTTSIHQITKIFSVNIALILILSHTTILKADMQDKNLDNLFMLQKEQVHKIIKQKPQIKSIAIEVYKDDFSLFYNKQGIVDGIVIGKKSKHTIKSLKLTDNLNAVIKQIGKPNRIEKSLFGYYQLIWIERNNLLIVETKKLNASDFIKTIVYCKKDSIACLF